jgi:hypothetical protein
MKKRRQGQKLEGEKRRLGQNVKKYKHRLEIMSNVKNAVFEKTLKNNKKDDWKMFNGKKPWQENLFSDSV